MPAPRTSFPAGEPGDRAVPPLSLEARTAGREHRITVRGAADHAAAARLGEAVMPALSGAHDRVVLDLREVGFIDVSCLRVLLGAQAAAASARLPLVMLVTPGGPVSRLFRLCTLETHFTTRTDDGHARAEGSTAS